MSKEQNLRAVRGRHRVADRKRTERVLEAWANARIDRIAKEQRRHVNAVLFALSVMVTLSLFVGVNILVR